MYLEQGQLEDIVEIQALRPPSSAHGLPGQTPWNIDESISAVSCGVSLGSLFPGETNADTTEKTNPSMMPPSSSLGDN